MKPFGIALVGAFVITAGFAVLWHVILFEQRFLALGIFSRMDDPIYAFGLGAWLLESLAIVLIFFRTNWRAANVADTVTFAWLMGAFAAASSLFGMAAKTRIDDLTAWFLLTGGFIVVHTTLLGLWLGLVAWQFRGD